MTGGSATVVLGLGTLAGWISWGRFPPGDVLVFLVTNAVVAVLQNGVEHEQPVGSLAGGAELVPTIVKYGGEQVRPGVVKHHTYGFLTAPDTPAIHR